MTDALRQQLLNLAREAVRREVRDRTGRATPLYEMRDKNSPEVLGAFVTLRTRGRLRGCIGTFSLRGSLTETIREMAVSAAHDPRFVQAAIDCAELDDLAVEVSLVGPLQRTEEPLSLVPGRHGVMIRRGRRSGCFLPQVARERGWDTETFLSNCCELKASLPGDAWKDPATEVYLFDVDILEEPAAGRPLTSVGT